MYYFAYGSNMDEAQAESRVGNFKTIGVATLPGYYLEFNKQSTDGSGKANIVSKKGSIIEGIIFQFSEDQMNIMDSYEKGYARSDPIQAILENNQTEIVTYIAKPDRINDGLSPTREYFEKIIKGAKMCELSIDYQNELKSRYNKLFF